MDDVRIVFQNSTVYVYFEHSEKKGSASGERAGSYIPGLSDYAEKLTTL